MKTTRIDVEGPNGTATLVRDGRCIHVTGTRLVKVVEHHGGKGIPVSERFRLLADAERPNANHKVAKELQEHLDGYRGTKGDVAECLRLIEALED